jgi:hypothetical protein
MVRRRLSTIQSNYSSIPTNLIKSQKMQYIVCHSVQEEKDGHNFMHNEKGLLVYNKNCGTIMIMSWHVSLEIWELYHVEYLQNEKNLSKDVFVHAQ